MRHIPQHSISEGEGSTAIIMYLAYQYTLSMSWQIRAICVMHVWTRREPILPSKIRAEQVTDLKVYIALPVHVQHVLVDQSHLHDEWLSQRGAHRHIGLQDILQIPDDLRLLQHLHILLCLLDDFLPCGVGRGHERCLHRQ